MVAKSLISCIVILVLLFVSAECDAQIKSVKIGVNGLTCSACCRTVEMSIRKLSFVKDVKMNLENTDGTIYFNEGSDIDVEKIAKAVVNAGFSVRYLNASFLFSKLKVSNDLCFHTPKYNLQFFNSTERILNGETEIKFIGQQFQPKSEYNKLKPLLINSCPDKNQKVYFITL